MKLKFKKLIQQGSFHLNFDNLKILFFCLLSIAIVTQGQYDPAPLNLLRPPGGIDNWLGLPGAILAGSMIFVLGQSSLLFPLGGIFFSGNGWSDFKALMPGSLLAVFSINTLVALLFRSNLSLLRELTGLWGVSSALVTENIFLRLFFISVFSLYLVRFFLSHRFNPELFFMSLRLGAITFSFSLLSVKAAQDFYFQKRRTIKLLIKQFDPKGGWYRPFFLHYNKRQQEYPLIFYNDLTTSNSKGLGSTPVNVNCDDLEKSDILQKTLAVMDENYPQT